VPQSLIRKQSEQSPVQSKSPKVRKQVLKAFMNRDHMSRKSELLSQVRKHATIFDKVNEMQKSIVATSSVGTNLVYQMIESSSQLAKASLENRSTSSLLNTSSVLKPVSNADITNLRTRYLDRCAQKNKVATFATESTEVRKSAPDYRSALLLLKQQEQLNQLRSSVQVLKPSQPGRTHPDIYLGSPRKGLDSQEPEVPLTGIGFYQKRAEEELLSKMARSAKKINSMKLKADWQIMKQIKIQNKIKLLKLGRMQQQDSPLISEPLIVNLKTI